MIYEVAGVAVEGSIYGEHIFIFIIILLAVIVKIKEVGQALSIILSECKTNQ